MFIVNVFYALLTLSCLSFAVFEDRNNEVQLLVVPGWRRGRNQRTHLEECIKMIDEDVGKSRRDAIEKKIIGYYVKGKLSEDHRQLLKDKISEYYGSVKGSESDA
jgi:hypothetical protein